MPFFDINTTLSRSGDAIKSLSVYNPLNIRKKGPRAKAYFALVLVCFFWGTTWVASKEGVKHMPPLQMAGIRQFIAGACYVVFFIFKRFPLPKGKEWTSILVLSVLNFMLSNGLSTWGVKYISSGLGSIMGAIFPLWLVVIGLFSSRSRIPLKAIIGLLLGFTGICIIFYDHLHDFFNADFRFGILLSLTATWTWAFATIYTKKHTADFNPYFSLGLQMMISGGILVILTHLTHNAISMSSIPWQSWTSMAFLVIFGSIIAFVAYLYALQNLSAEQTSVYAYINPVVAILIGWLLFGEKLTIFIALGGIVTLFGVYMVNKAYKIK